jgi:hypothetical protein
MKFSNFFKCSLLFVGNFLNRFIRIKKDFLINKAYLSVGCYSSKSACGYCDVFKEQGLNLTQCNNVANFYSVSCVKTWGSYAPPCQTWYYPITSGSMTIKLCLTICKENCFTYAGLY